MTAILFAAREPERLAEFWSKLVGDDLAVPIRFFASDDGRPDLNRGHLHLTSDSLEHQQRTVAHALRLGARHLDVGQKPEEGHIVLGDPEGNAFCVMEPGNNFLAGTGFVGELTCDGHRAVGLFWSAALGWPLVWDQDEETSIQSPSGGTKISWGGPPVDPRVGPDRILLEIDGDIDRLLGLGATLVDAERGVLADPDGNHFKIKGY